MPRPPRDAGLTRPRIILPTPEPEPVQVPGHELTLKPYGPTTIAATIAACTCDKWWHVYTNEQLDKAAFDLPRTDHQVHLTKLKEPAMPSPALTAGKLTLRHIGATIRATTTNGVQLEDEVTAIRHEVIDGKPATRIAFRNIAPAMETTFSLFGRPLTDGFAVHPDTVVTVTAEAAERAA